MTVKKTDTGDAGLFYLLFYTIYCNENRLKNNMTPYEPRHEKTCLGTDHLIFWGRGVGGWVFSSRFSSRFFSHSPKAKIFFSGQSKNNFFFSKQHICSKCIRLDLYVYFLNPIYMGIYFICSCIHVSWIFGSEWIWPATWQNQQYGCAPSEDSDQPEHPPSLIRVFAVRMKKH